LKKREENYQEVEGLVIPNPIEFFKNENISLGKEAEKAIEWITGELNRVHIENSNWTTIKNIFAYKQWKDPVFDRFHIIFYAKRKKSAAHIGEIVEKCSGCVDCDDLK